MRCATRTCARLGRCLLELANCGRSHSAQQSVVWCPVSNHTQWAAAGRPCEQTGRALWAAIRRLAQDTLLNFGKPSQIIPAM